MEKERGRREKGDGGGEGALLATTNASSRGTRRGLGLGGLEGERGREKES